MTTEQYFTKSKKRILDSKISKSSYCSIRNLKPKNKHIFLEDCLPMDTNPPRCEDYVNPVTKEPVFIEHKWSKFL